MTGGKIGRRFFMAMLRTRPAARAVFAFTCCSVFAQAPDPRLTFDVASIKLSTGAPIGAPNSDGGPGTRYPERFATNATLRGLAYRAFGLIDYQGPLAGPNWIDKDLYAIDARVPPGTSIAPFQIMLQNLLADRFKLTVHHETIVLHVYELVVAKNVSKLRESVPGDAVPAPPPQGSDRDGFPIMPPGRPGISIIYSSGANGEPQNKWRAQQQTIAAFAKMLSLLSNLGRIVVDKTGLTGKYDFTLYYDIPQPTAPGAADNPTLSIFDAVEQQLGLKLVSGKQSFDRIVVDHAEKTPTGN
jgi:uncharacterized protein (TIGR03435 family)